MGFYKGYVPTKDKRAAESFKNKAKLKTLKEIEKFPEYAGILEKNIILLDIDDPEQSEILFKVVKHFKIRCRVYETTRGKHFLLENDGVESNKTGCKLAIGLKADIKLGSRNSYEVLKYNGKKRKILYDTAENEEAQKIPRWLFPVKCNTNFLDMDNGSGRNQALYNYILTLSSHNFTKEETRETIRIINKFIFSEPLPDNELDIILRDEAFQKPIFFNGTKFMFDKFANYLKVNCHIIKLNNQLHLYKEGVYIHGINEIENEMIQLIPDLNRAKRTEVLTYLDVLIRDNEEAGNANLIAFQNGIYNLLDDSFTEFSPDYIIPNKINWKYDPEAYSKLADETLNKIACNDPEIRKILEEAIGSCFYRRNIYGKAFILTGDKSNGKSTFLAMLQRLLGDKNIASLDLKELGDRFKTAELFGKLANIGDDIGDEFIPNTAVFKKLVTGERVSAERKGRDPFEFNNYSKLLFSANNIPRMKDKTGAVLRRLIILPFNAKFSESDPDFDPLIKVKLQTDEVMAYLINIGLSGLKRLIQNHAFTRSSKVQKELDEYEEMNNPILGFFAECENEDFKIENEPTNKVYKRYREYCTANSFQPMSNIEFSKQVNKVLGFITKLKKIKGKVFRIYVSTN